ncbi:gamma-aminobutyric acid receptor-associated protein-like 2 [Meleagris gallopavo]|uniref:gamma-aminobutyric acid receptor-associated protein-like 2 n=1 Tax=Meleagris gallopavo TaxID=9103 RepID=UPI0012ABDA55|nr:gamma-aminobutyric acid receptor-associated protein-like 2 [Meleagris gallopavo]
MAMHNDQCEKSAGKPNDTTPTIKRKHYQIRIEIIIYVTKTSSKPKFQDEFKAKKNKTKLKTWEACEESQEVTIKVEDEHRCVESAKIRAKYPDRVPVIVEKVSGSQIVDIDKRKYLVPSDITVAQFMWIIRKRIQLPSEKAIFLFVDKTVPQSSLTMGQLYEKEKDEDGFLYVAYSGENTFGF